MSALSSRRSGRAKKYQTYTKSYLCLLIHLYLFSCCPVPRPEPSLSNTIIRHSSLMCTPKSVT
jgi:hypothetical protein